MSEPIGVGDVVYVYRTCCDGTAHQSLGLHGKVYQLQDAPMVICAICGHHFGGIVKARFCYGLYPAAPLSWLKRIDPLTSPETVIEREQEPA